MRICSGDGEKAVEGIFAETMRKFPALDYQKNSALFWDGEPEISGYCVPRRSLVCVFHPSMGVIEPCQGAGSR